MLSLTNFRSESYRSFLPVSLYTLMHQLPAFYVYDPLIKLISCRPTSFVVSQWRTLLPHNRMDTRYILRRKRSMLSFQTFDYFVELFK